MDPAERAFLNEQPLYKLLFPDPDRPGYRHYQPYIDEALAERTELTLAIGDADAMNRARDSKLWHPFQNEVGLFPDGWYQTLHMSYAGHYDQFTIETLHWITGRLPMIRHLNIMFSCVKPAIEPTGNIEQLLFLIHMYSPHLVTFRLWVSGPLYWPIRRATFCALLFGTLKHIPNLATLWLDLTQLVRNDRLPDEFPPLVPLENLFQNRRLFDNLIEFRYATTSTTQFEVLSEQVAPIGNLARIYIASGSQFYEDWITIEWNTARAFREISVLLNDGIGNLRQFFTTFDALTRLNVELVQGGPRFMELFRALARVPHLQVLTVDSFQSPLFTPEDSAQNGLAPLHALRILVVHMNIRMASCAQISFKPLFVSDPGQPPIPVPNLVCFKMSVQGGECRQRYHNQNQCVFLAVNQWFALLRDTVYVQYSNLENEPDDILKVGGFLGIGGIDHNHYPLPQSLDE